MNNTTPDIYIQGTLWALFSVLLSNYLVMELLCHMTLWDRLVPKVATSSWILIPGLLRVPVSPDPHQHWLWLFFWAGLPGNWGWGLAWCLWLLFSWLMLLVLFICSLVTPISLCVSMCVCTYMCGSAYWTHGLHPELHPHPLFWLWDRVLLLPRRGFNLCSSCLSLRGW